MFDAALHDIGGDIDGLRRELLRTRMVSLAPPPRMSPSEWAEERVKLSRQTTSQAGRLKLFPYQRGILDAFAEEGAEVVSFLKSARVGYTQILALGIGYFLEHSASPILSVFPAEQDARYFEKTYIRPLVRDTDCLNEILPDLEDQQWHSKATLRGSSLEMKQAVKYDSFRAFNARLAIGDEVDAPGWNPGKEGTGEGDKTALFRKRTESFPDGRMILGSTPTIKGRSRVEAWFNRGDQRRRFLPCPHCTRKNGGVPSGFQHLEWGGKEKGYGVTWPEGHPEEAFYVCKFNGKHHIDETEKAWMDENGEWRATAKGERGIISFHINALYSPFKKASWGRLAEEFVESMRLDRENGDKERLQAFINTSLGETWDPREEEKGLLKAHELSKLCRGYRSAVPAEVKFLTAGADTQTGKRGEGSWRAIEIVGWGEREKPFHIGYWHIQHPVETKEHEDELARILLDTYVTDDGRRLHVQAACIDAGGDYQEETVRFCQSWRQMDKRARWWFPIKGWSAGEGKRGEKIWRTPLGQTVKTYSVDVDRAKDWWFNKIHGGEKREDLLVMPTESMIPGTEAIDLNFFESLTSEKKVWAKRGDRYPTWQGKKGNEASDCFTYNTASLSFLKSLPAPNLFIGMLAGELSSNVRGQATKSHGKPETVEVAEETGPNEPASPSPKPTRKRKKGFRTLGSRR